MAKAPKRPGDIRFSVSLRHFAYLKWLSENTILGATENEVAKQVLTQRLSEMRGENFKDDETQ